MNYTSTRNADLTIGSNECLLGGLAADGGLYVPSSFPVLDYDKLRAYLSMNYAEIAADILSPYLDLDPVFLSKACERAYARFEDEDPAPVIKIDDRLFVCELWHGPTSAFKDVALTLLPDLLGAAKAKTGDRCDALVLTATSGDTGKAALEGFRDRKGSRVMVFYPENGVSALQRLQMTTQRGLNVNVTAVKGNFDDAQRAVKDVFADVKLAAELAKQNVRLSSANSINIGRLIPQIVYYVSSYLSLCESREIKWGDKINFCVPTGNFGNILAGWYAKQMGLPIDKLICASNRNSVLTDFFSKGEYTVAKREFYKTSSPSMDILISSNLERLLFELSGRDAGLTARRMADLKGVGRYSVTPEERETLSRDFAAYAADEPTTMKALFHTFDEYGYIVDPHTAVAFSAVYQRVKETRDKTKTVVLSTASPYKFTDAVLTGLKKRPPADPFAAMRRLETLTALPIPKELSALEKAPVRFSESIGKNETAAAVRAFAFK